MEVYGKSQPDGSVNTKKAESEKKLIHLLGIINITINRYSEAISRYSCMNDGLSGPVPVCESDKVLEGCGPGLASELIVRMEVLHDMAAELNNQNNRLNQVISE